MAEGQMVGVRTSQKLLEQTGLLVSVPRQHSMPDGAAMREDCTPPTHW